MKHHFPYRLSGANIDVYATILTLKHQNTTCWSKCDNNDYGEVVEIFRCEYNSNNLHVVQK